MTKPLEDMEITSWCEELQANQESGVRSQSRGAFPTEEREMQRLPGEARRRPLDFTKGRSPATCRVAAQKSMAEGGSHKGLRRSCRLPEHTTF